MDAGAREEGRPACRVGEPVHEAPVPSRCGPSLSLPSSVLSTPPAGRHIHGRRRAIRTRRALVVGARGSHLVVALTWARPLLSPRVPRNLRILPPCPTHHNGALGPT